MPGLRSPRQQLGAHRSPPRPGERSVGRPEPGRGAHHGRS